MVITVEGSRSINKKAISFSIGSDCSSSGNSVTVNLVVVKIVVANAFAISVFYS